MKTETGKTETENIYKETFPDVCSIITTKIKSTCSCETLKHRLPILQWLPSYKAKLLLCDFVAGLTVGLTVIPQGIAFAVIAGLPTQYGLYSAFMGCFIYIIFGTCKDITIGPTAIMSLMVQTHVSSNPDFAILATFLTGCIILLLGILNLGVLVQFISVPVVTGFTTAAAITIASGQINTLFGIRSSSNEFYSSWKNFFTNIKQININDMSLGLTTLAFLLLFRKLGDVKMINKTVAKYLSLSRNALAVIIGITITYFLTSDENQPFTITGYIEPGLPKFKPPAFKTSTEDGNIISFSAMVEDLGSSLFTISFIAILEIIAISKTFANGKPVDASQEMIALGLCNIFSSFVQSMPITGSFSRSAVNNASGVQTTLGGAFTGLLVILALSFLTKTFYFIPKSSLSAIIIAAMIFMVEYHRIAEIWNAKKIDVIPMVLTIAACLFIGLEYGMLVGVAINFTFVLYISARPNIEIRSETIENNKEVTLVEIYGDLRYSSAEYLKDKILKHSQINKHITLLVIDGEKLSSIDSTVGMSIFLLKEELNKNNAELLLWNWNIACSGVLYRLERLSKQLLIYGKDLNNVLKERNLESNVAIECIL